jgi:hypothetical protein
MVSVFSSSAIGHGFELRSGKNKDYAIFFYFSAKHTLLMSTSKEWLVRIRIMRPSGTTCLFADCCFSELALSNSS